MTTYLLNASELNYGGCRILCLERWPSVYSVVESTSNQTLHFCILGYVLRYFILLLHYSSNANIAICSPLRLFDNFSYQLLSPFRLIAQNIVNNLWETPFKCFSGMILRWIVITRSSFCPSLPCFLLINILNSFVSQNEWELVLFSWAW